MFIININNIDKFNKVKNGYTYNIDRGLYLKFNSNLEYETLETYYNISCKNYNKIESDTLVELYRLGLILLEK